MTVNKAQGSSMDFVVVPMPSGNRGKISREMLNVACSRARRKDGLSIKGNFVAPVAPAINDPVTQELKRLREILHVEFLLNRR